MNLFRIFLIPFFLLSLTSDDFLGEQKRYKRVRKALEDKKDEVKINLEANKIALENLEIAMVAFKEEDELQIYAKNKEDSSFLLLKTYNICRKSGRLGPKRKQGDRQVPEGFYHIDRFNPASSYYLSLGINYPNQSDQIKSTAHHLGGDIFIHGECVTIGCLPMTNDKIKEIYLLAVFARNNGQLQIPVYIFPFKMDEMKFGFRKLKYGDDRELIKFWENLQIGYNLFFKEKQRLHFKVNQKGDYVF